MEYWEGRQNKFARYWVYLDNGFNQVNKARYFGLGIVALAGFIASGAYFGWLWTSIVTGGTAVILIPLIALLGRWHLYNVAKAQEYINRSKGTVLGYSEFNLQLEILERLKEISENTKRTQDETDITN